jgi:predicted phosphodiesterase
VATPVSIWGLVSDVHGNLPALEEALQVLERAGAQRFAFLGDYLGRGDSDGCVRRIRDVGEVAVVGNRDLDWQDRVSAESKAWVLSLPRVVAVDGLLLAHGDARLTRRLSTEQIGRQFAEAWSEMEAHAARVLAFGHSHFARTWRKGAAAEPAERQPLSAEIQEPYRYFVNVGTTGLPFAGKGGPSVAIVSDAMVRHLPLSWWGEA